MTVTENRSPYILVADDHSVEARAAANAAFQIARNLKLTIQGLYVIDEGLALDTYANYHAELPDLSFTPNGNVREPTSRAELMSWFETQGRVALRWLETAFRCRHRQWVSLNKPGWNLLEQCESPHRQMEYEVR